MGENILQEETQAVVGEEIAGNEPIIQQHYYYAQIDDDGVCTGLSDLAGEVDAPNMIQLDSYDMNVMGKKYEAGTWVEVEQPTPEPPESAEPQPTNAEIKNLLLEVQEQNLILMESLAEMYEQSVDETTV